MSRVEAIESEIKQLSASEFAELREWLLKEDAVAWDRQFEHDATSGRLSGLFKKAEEDHEAGKSREI
jgi:hypothetical protein